MRDLLKPSREEIKGWLKAFQAEPAKTVQACPNDMYAYLRGRYLYANHELTEEGDAYLRLV